MEKYCICCKHYDGLICCNKNTEHYGWIQNKYRSCDGFEPKELGSATEIVIDVLERIEKQSKEILELLKQREEV